MLSIMNNLLSTTCHPSFKFLGTKNIDALKIEVEQFEHLNTGAMYYHLKADDPEYGGEGSERFLKAVAGLRQVLDGASIQEG